MFSFFRKKNPVSPAVPEELAPTSAPAQAADAAAAAEPPATSAPIAAPPAQPAAVKPESSSFLSAATPSPEGLGPAPAAVALAWLKRTFSSEETAPAAPDTAATDEDEAKRSAEKAEVAPGDAFELDRAAPSKLSTSRLAPSPPPDVIAPAPAPTSAPIPVLNPAPTRETVPAPAPAPPPSPTPSKQSLPATAVPRTIEAPPKPAVALPSTSLQAPTNVAAETAASRARWLDRLRTGLKKTGSGLTTVFTGTRIDEALYEELEDALLMADTGVKATQFLLVDLKRRVKEARATDVAAVRALLADAIAALLRPLEKPLVIGEFTPTVIMVAGVNGAGKTTSIGKLTHHLAQEGATVLLAAADTFRAAAREQLGVWATRNTVEIIGQQGGDPAAVSFDAVVAGKARGRDVVLVDTAGRLPTQVHLMEELKKIRRVIQKADATAPHEVLLVIDGNTGQNALAQVKAFDDVLQLTGLIVTKLDGTAKGGVLAAIAQERPVPVYFIGVGESLLDLETFNAREFAQALLG